MVICLGEFAHAILAVGRVDVNDIHLPLILNQEILQRFVIVADNQFVRGFAVVRVKTEVLIFFEIPNVIGFISFQSGFEIETGILVCGSQLGNHYGLVIVIRIVDKFL